jgi:hypothetical protein
LDAFTATKIEEVGGSFEDLDVERAIRKRL